MKKQTTIDRKSQSGIALPEETKLLMKSNKHWKMNSKLTEMLLKNLCNNYYKESEEKCAKQRARICELEVKSSKTEAETDELSTPKHFHTIVKCRLSNAKVAFILG